MHLTSSCSKKKIKSMKAEKIQIEKIKYVNINIMNSPENISKTTKSYFEYIRVYSLTFYISPKARAIKLKLN